MLSTTLAAAVGPFLGMTFHGNGGFTLLFAVCCALTGSATLAALFITIFISQWQSSDNHQSALAGLVISAACLALFGAQQFLLPSMLLIAALFIYFYYRGGKKA